VEFGEIVFPPADRRLLAEFEAALCACRTWHQEALRSRRSLGNFSLVDGCVPNLLDGNVVEGCDVASNASDRTSNMLSAIFAVLGGSIEATSITWILMSGKTP
jgi:hypothetical protein